MQGLYYSLSSLYPRAIMLESSTKINVYVEDANKEYEYETILKRLLGEYYQYIGQIVGLGGKQLVKKFYRENGTTTKDRLNFYIVDGDFDRYIDKENMIIDDCFIYLKSYNIENYFIDEKACEEFAKGRLKCLDSEVHQRIKFAEWKNSLVDEIYPLFLYFSLSQQEHLGEPTLSQKPAKFVDFITGSRVRTDEIENYKEHISTLVVDAETKIAFIKEKYECVNGNEYFNLICGKFLLKCLYAYITPIIGDFRHNDFRNHLIGSFDIKKLEYVRYVIINIIKDKSSI